MLSPNANRQRLALLLKLDATAIATTTTVSNGTTAVTNSPLPYAVANGSDGKKSHKEFDSNAAECYEELESNSEWSACSSNYNNVSLYSHDTRQICNRLSSSSRSNDSHCPKKQQEVLYENTYNGIESTGPNTANSDHSVSPSTRSDESTELATLGPSYIRCYAIKFGQLSRREKIIFVEHTKKYWAGLLGTILYIYHSEKECKPSHFINVDEYKARPISVTPSCKKDFGFEIVCPGRKTHQFWALSKSDMETWISCINHSLPIPQTSTSCSFSASSIIHPGYYVCNHNNNQNAIGNTIDSSKSKRYRLNRSSMGNVARTAETVINEADTAAKRNSLKWESAATMERQLPSIPSSDVFCEHYDKPNPVIRPVMRQNGHTTILANAACRDHETFYHSIEEAEADALSRYDYPVKKECYYNYPDMHISKANTSRPSSKSNTNIYYNMVSSKQGNDTVTKKNQNNCRLSNEETIYDGVAEEEKENCNIGVGRIQQIIQQIEEINQKNSTSKKVSPLSNRNSKIISNTPPSLLAVHDEIYELVNTPTIINGKV